MKILLTHTPKMLADYYGPRAVRALQGLGEVKLHHHDQPLPPADLVAAAADCDIIVSDRNTPGPAVLFEQSPRLLSFHRCAVDIRTVDVEAASRHGVLVTRASPGFVDAVVEWVLGAMVDLARGIGRYTRDYHAGKVPQASMGRQLAGSTVGIIGFGQIGARLAEVTQMLGMTVLVTDPHKQVPAERARQLPLPELLEASDFVVCLAVATAETENLMNADAFSRMRPEAFFINASRGDLVDEEALAEALGAKRIAGAALDVGRASDQMPSPNLARLVNVVATPHIGGLTPAAIQAQASETVEQVRAIVEGRTPHNVVNALHATRFRERFCHTS
jgi:D-3-phosphoglycerate dehydrogenase / 2-oxoglutarate reductase